MTIMEAIHHIDAVKPNRYSQSEKVKWLSNLDGIVKKDIIDTHEGGEEVTFNGYTDEMNLSTTELLIPEPYDDVYVFWLESKIDYWNGEIGKYNNSISMFNEAYKMFEKQYHRKHMPIRRGKRFIF